MNPEHIGKRVAWGKPEKVGTVMACVPAEASINAIARTNRLPSVPRFAEDRSPNDRYLVRTDPAGRRKATWHAVSAVEVDAALAAATTEFASTPSASTVSGACQNCQRIWSWTARTGVLRVTHGEAHCPDCGQPLQRATKALRASYVEATALPLDAAAAAPVRAQRVADHADATRRSR